MLTKVVRDELLEICSKILKNKLLGPESKSNKDVRYIY